MDKSATIICLKGPLPSWVLLCMICDNKIEWLHFEQYPDKLPSLFLVYWPLVRKKRLLDQIETKKLIDLCQKLTSLLIKSSKMHYGLYACVHYLVCNLVELDPGRLVFITKREPKN